VDTILLDAGQQVERGMPIATIGDPVLVDYTNRATLRPTYLHFAIRIKPFNRFDGWGGFVDPLPYLNPTRLQFVADLPPEQTPTLPPHAMIREQGQSRRP
jgi:murein DD-endopeptidase MepM/ murein hydrolase activator NlpD